MGFWDKHESEDFTALTPGPYTAVLNDATTDFTYKNKKDVSYPLMKLKWKIQGGDFDGRILFQDIRFMDSMGWKVNLELSRLDALPNVSDGASWETVAEEAATIVFKKVGIAKVALNVGVREYKGKQYNEVEIDALLGAGSTAPPNLAPVASDDFPL